MTKTERILEGQNRRATPSSTHAKPEYTPRQTMTDTRLHGLRTRGPQHETFEGTLP